MPPPAMTPGKVILVALTTVVIFAAGVVTGGLLVRDHSRPQSGVPFLGRVEIINRATQQLDLSPEQRQRIALLVRDSREQIADYFMILEPDVQQVFRTLREQIRSELSPAQRRQFEEILRRRSHRQNERRNEPVASATNAPAGPR